MIINKTIGDKNCTALMIAAFRGYIGIIYTLIAAGANLTKTNVQGQTLLDIAAQENHNGIIALLRMFLGRQLSSVRQ